VIQKVAIKTLGCRVNQAESDALRYDLEQNGFLVVSDLSQAELIVVNSCAVTQGAEAKLRGTLTALRRLAPQAKLAVVGCATYRDPDLLRERFGVVLILGNSTKNRLAAYIRRLAEEAIIVDIEENEPNQAFLPADPDLHPERVRVMLKVQDGCDYFCNYCIVPTLRGKPRSKPLVLILQEVRQLVANGCHEVVLTGINLGLYQTPEGGLVTLVERLLNETALERLRLSSVEPDLISYELIDLMRVNPRLCPHWHIPLQHGSDRILRLMGRRYNSAYFTQLVDQIRQQVPQACIGADVIVGYPEETPADFATMYQFLQELDLNYLHVFRYSPRPGTGAYQKRDQVTSIEKRRRSNLLLALSQHKRRQFRERFLHQTCEVLIEEQTGGDEWQGLTRNYLPVRVISKEDLFNQLVDVKITTAAGAYLRGELNRG
jgi:threonylcarbamoyladenosine tRNA methylthiotransferase MtaB